MTFKVCKIHGELEEKDIGTVLNKSRGKVYICTTCRICIRLQQKRYRALNSEKIKIKDAKYRKTFTDEKKEFERIRAREWRRKNSKSGNEKARCRYYSLSREERYEKNRSRYEKGYWKKYFSDPNVKIKDLERRKGWVKNLDDRYIRKLTKKQWGVCNDEAIDLKRALIKLYRIRKERKHEPQDRRHASATAS